MLTIDFELNGWAQCVHGVIDTQQELEVTREAYGATQYGAAVENWRNGIMIGVCPKIGEHVYWIATTPQHPFNDPDYPNKLRASHEAPTSS